MSDRVKLLLIAAALFLLAACTKPATDPSAWKTYNDPVTGATIRCYAPNGLESNATTLACYEPSEVELTLLEGNP